jgi:hypothetical protein
MEMKNRCKATDLSWKSSFSGLVVLFFSRVVFLKERKKNWRSFNLIGLNLVAVPMAG